MSPHFKSPKADAGTRFTAPDNVDASPDTLHPAFCLRYLQPDGAIPKEKAKRAKILDKFRMLGSMTWSQIKGDRREANGYETIEQLRERIPTEFKKRYPDTDVVGFRCSREGRFYGVRQNKVLYIFWFDWTPFKLIKH